MNLPPAKTNVPPSGSLDASYVFVGEQPGKTEVKTHRPFSGPAGEELDKNLNTALISRPLTYMTNVIKNLDSYKDNYIQMYKNKRLLKEPIISPPGQQQIDFLKWELEQTSAQVFGAIGAISLFVLTGKIGINKWRGSILDCTLVAGRKVVPLLHPATVIKPKYQFLNRRLISFDLKRINEIVSGLYVPTDREIIIEPSFYDTMNFLDYCRTKGLEGNRVAYDIEVYMKRVHKHVSCISFAVGLKSICIPFANAQGDYFLKRQEAEVWKMIADLLENPKIRKVAQNAVFDSHFLLRTLGIRVTNIDDTMIAQNIILPDYPKGLHFITSIFTDHAYYKDDGKDFIGSTSEAYKRYWIYNATDSVICSEVMPKQAEELRRLGDTEIYDNQVNVIGPLVYMMERGIKVDVGGMQRLNREYEQKINDAQVKLNALAGEPLNANSNKQLYEYFCIKKKLTPYTKQKKPTFDDDAIKRFIRRGFKEAIYIKDIRRFTKLRSTYLDIVKISSDERFRCSYNPAGTRFSRLSSSANIWEEGGNSQNWPHELQEFLLPDSGYVYYAFDLEQAENRIVAYVGEILNMIECFETGQDVHSKTALMIMNIYYNRTIPDNMTVHSLSPLGDGTQDWRFWGKKANHCILNDTDVLTEAGWVPVDQASFENNKIACYSVRGNNITFEVPSRWHSEEYSGDLVNFKGKYVSQRVTAGHRIPFRSRYEGKSVKLKWSRADQIKLTSGREWPLAGTRIDGNIEISELYIRLLIAFQADGGLNYNAPIWHLKNPLKIRRLKLILTLLKVDFTERKSIENESEFTIIYIKAHNIEKDLLKFAFPEGKYWPYEMINLNQKCIEIFCDEIVRWDGDGSCYWTSIKRNAEIVQTMFHLGGFKSSIGWACKQTGTYRVSKIHKPETRLDIITRTFEKVEKVKVYCPTVSTGLFLIRHNGIISVTGNSFNYDFGYKNFALRFELSEKDGKIIYDAYHKLYPGVQQNFQMYVRYCLRKSRSLVNLRGRKTLFMKALEGEKADLTFKEAYSCIPQGTVGDIINKQGLNYVYYNQNLFKPVELLRQVHDEIGFQVPLSVPWEDHAKMLLLIKKSLEIELTTHNGRKFTIPAGLTMAKTLNKSTGKDIKMINAETLEKNWRELNEKTT